MRRLRLAFGTIVLALVAGRAVAGDFTGTWSIDLRTSAERDRKAECGFAEFNLAQTNDKVEGSHSFGTVDCGRMNEGGPGTVKGIVIDSKAILVITSGRNGEMAMGIAALEGDALLWQVLSNLRQGDTSGDSGLILARGTLHRAKETSGPQQAAEWPHNYAACEARSPRSQFEINRCASLEYQEADRELNSIYQRVLEVDPNANKLKEAQRAWLTFRDKVCIYDQALVQPGGSSAGMYYQGCLTRHTKRRIEDLRRDLQKSGY